MNSRLWLKSLSSFPSRILGQIRDKVSVVSYRAAPIRERSGSPIWGWAMAFSAVWLLLPWTACGMDPDRAMSQYLHDRWGAEQGFPPGPVYAITQTPDGYLWIG